MDSNFSLSSPESEFYKKFPSLNKANSIASTVKNYKYINNKLDTNNPIEIRDQSKEYLEIDNLIDNIIESNKQTIPENQTKRSKLDQPNSHKMVSTDEKYQSTSVLKTEEKRATREGQFSSKNNCKTYKLFSSIL